jgi:outer membrane protein assembly factor BamA
VRQAGLFNLIIFIAVSLFTGACSNTRFLNDDQQLYTGLVKTRIEGRDKIKSVKYANEVVEAITSVKPNNSIFGTRRVWPPFGLWTHNYFKSEKRGKDGGWIYRNFAKDPVLISTVNPELRCDQLEKALFGYGFFHATATYELQVKKSNRRKAKIGYVIQLDSAFRLNRILTNPPADSVDLFINKHIENSDLNPGDVFNVDLMKSEKSVIASQLVEQGYYFVGPNNIEFIADTTRAPYKVDLKVGKDAGTPGYVFNKYRVGDIKVRFIRKSIDKDKQTSSQDSIFYQGIYIIGSSGILVPEAVRHCIQFDTGDLYSGSRHQGTIKQLNNYGIFRSVRVQFLIADTALQQLNMLVELTPKDNVSLDLEGYVQGKSTGFAGPGMEATLAHGNIGRKANRLQLKLTGEFEWQIGNQSADNLGSNSWNAGISTAFVFPRFILPFTIRGEKNLLSSRTICDLGFEFLNNVRYYRMTSTTAGYSYQWKKRQKITNTFSPVKINMVNLLQTTAEFDSIVESNIYVKKSFEEQTILGMEYGFTYDNTTVNFNGTYVQAIVSTSGNLASLISGAGNSEEPYKIFGNVYSQFLKASLDMRYYTRTIKKGMAFRVYAGSGYSYGNTSVMPYIEQFYSGGSTSLRAFTARSLGPGSYIPEEQNGIIDQTGDIRLEFNAEYRVAISGTVYGAVFADVGNVWLLNEDENRPGSGFAFNTFTKQLAVGTGFGLRFDFDFFVLRTDLGLPLRNTYESDDGYWLDDFSKVFSGSQFSLAIGYPF